MKKKIRAGIFDREKKIRGGVFDREKKIRGGVRKIRDDREKKSAVTVKKNPRGPKRPRSS